jgi:transposase
MERPEYDLLFRWFVRIGVEEAAWDHSSFSTIRDRLLEGTSRRSSWLRCWPSLG